MSEEPSEVSQEAFDRVTGQKDAAEAKIAELENAVLAQGRKEIVRSHFVDKKLDDPDWAAGIAVPNLPANIDTKDDIKTFLDENFVNLYPSDNGEEPEPEPNVAAPDAVEPPGFARPSPASDGTPPDQKVFTTSDPEIKALIESNDLAAIQRMEKEGTFRWQYTATPEEKG